MRGDAGLPGPAAVHEARQGAVGSRTATSPARFERAFRIEPSCRSRSPQGFSPRPKVSFGLALVDRARERRPSTSTSSCVERGRPRRRCPRLLDRSRCPRASTSPASSRSSSGHRRCRRPSRPSAASVDGSTAPVHRVAPTTARAPRRQRRHARGANGAQGHARSRGRAAGHPPARDGRRRRRATASSCRARPRSRWHPKPGDSSPRSRELAAHRPTVLGEDRVLRTHQWIERDGTRLRTAGRRRATHAATAARAS